ncbi:MAG: Tol-Pal system beta propeller repeat protein TolB [Mariprofundaceae bacterium]
MSVSTVLAVEFDVYQSDYTPLRLAWSIDASVEKKAVQQQIYHIVKRDLTSSQSFSALDPLSFLADTRDAMDKVDYGDWRIIGADVLALCHLEKSGDGWVATLQLHDPFRGKSLGFVTLRRADDEIRELAHDLSNYIYQQVIGVPGHFNSQIVYVEKHGDAADLIYMDQDGFAKQAVGKNFTLLLSPDWSPQGNLIALNTYVGNRPRLETFNLYTGERKAFGTFSGLNSTPEWSPDGRFIAAALSYTGNTEIHVYDTKNGKWRQLTHHRAIDTTPSWSPDGKELVFCSGRDGDLHIYSLRLADGRVNRVSLAGRYNTSPSWSPRGDRIAFITRKKWEYALATMRPDGSDLRYLVTGGEIESPSWSPNGQMLLFSREVASVRRVYRIPAWGGRAEAMTSARHDASDPAWSR